MTQNREIRNFQLIANKNPIKVCIKNRKSSIYFSISVLFINPFNQFTNLILKSKLVIGFEFYLFSFISSKYQYKQIITKLVQMQGSFIRNVDFRYQDPIEKVILEQQIPKKFIQTGRILSRQFDDYKRKPLITVIRPNSSKPHHAQTQQTCFTKLFSCLQVELCPQCRSQLCQQCSNTKFLKLFICDFCQKKLCPSCRRNLQGKKIKLRNYNIRLKNVKDLHFKDCQCVDCVTERQKN